MNPSTPRPTRADLKHYLLSLGIVALITGLSYLIREAINPANLVMPYLLGVVFIASWYGRGPAVFASVLSVVLFDFFLVPHFFTFGVEDTEYIITFLAFFIVSVVISNLTSQIREQMEAAREREARVVALYHLSNDLAVAYSRPAVMDAVIERVRDSLAHDVWIFLAKLGRSEEGSQPSFELVATPGAPDHPLDSAIRYAYQYGRVSGYQTEAFETGQTINLPLNTNSGVAGVMCIAVNGPGGALSPEKRQLFEAFANLTALALERLYLEAQAHQAQLLRAKEEFQSTLLNSVSHDFRTPLVTITGTLSSLDSDRGRLAPEEEAGLVHNALREAEKLNTLVGNLLNISRLESGALHLQSEPIDLQDLIGATLAHMQERIERPIHIQVPDEPPMVSGDFVLLGQVLENILDNAVKYSPEGSPISIRVYPQEGRMYLEVADQGVGISPIDLPHIFEKFYRVKGGARPSGTGLGLAIVKGILDIHQAGIKATPGEGGGMVFQVCFPRPVQP